MRPIVVTQRQPSFEDLGWPPELGAERRAELLRLVAETPQARRGDLVYVASTEGVEVLERALQAQLWRRHGLPQLARRLREIPVGRLAVVLLGDDVAVLSVAPRFVEASP